MWLKIFRLKSGLRQDHHEKGASSLSVSFLGARPSPSKESMTSASSIGKFETNYAMIFPAWSKSPVPLALYLEKADIKTTCQMKTTIVMESQVRGTEGAPVL